MNPNCQQLKEQFQKLVSSRGELNNLVQAVTAQGFDEQLRDSFQELKKQFKDDSAEIEKLLWVSSYEIETILEAEGYMGYSDITEIKGQKVYIAIRQDKESGHLYKEYVGLDGKPIMRPPLLSFANASPFANGHSRVRIPGLHTPGFLSEDHDYFDHIIVGGELFDIKECHPFSGGVAAVQVKTADGLVWGIIDTNKKLVKDTLKYEGARPTTEGLTAVLQTTPRRGWIFIKSDGSLLNDNTYIHVRKFSCGRAAVLTLNNEWFFIDTNGEVVSGPHNHTSSYSDDLAHANNLIIDLKGSEVDSKEFIAYTDFANGRAIGFQKGASRNESSIIDKNFNQIARIDGKFVSLSHDRVVIARGSDYYILDAQTGQEIAHPFKNAKTYDEFRYLGHKAEYIDGLIILEFDDDLGQKVKKYINRSGKIVGDAP